VPALLLTFVCFSYLMLAPVKTGGLNLAATPGIIVAAVLSLVVLLAWVIKVRHNRNLQLKS
ncbi:MAG TPA: hypothetical protein PLA77_10140, partial [Bacteroidales bacterium]|nr:hypothetical protein [Bacteroidales bacterium]